MNEVVKKRFHLCFHTLPSFTEFSLLSRISSVNWTGFRYSNYLITYTVVPYLVSIVYLVLPSFTISTFNHFIRFISSNLFYGIYKGTTSCFNSLPSFTEFRHFFGFLHRFTFVNLIRFSQFHLFYYIYTSIVSCFNNLPSLTEFRHFFFIVLPSLT